MTMRAGWRRGLETVLPFIVLAGIWQGLAVSGWFPSALAPSVPQILERGWDLAASGVLFGHLAASTSRLAAGFLIGAAFGTAVGLAMGLWRPVERFFLPLLNLALPIPSIALVPLMVLWFGLGNGAVVILVAFVSALQVAMNMWTGVRATDESLLRVGRSMNVSRWMMVRSIVLPSAAPFLLTGLRLGLARGWIGTVAGEMVSSSSWGLGWMIFNAMQFLQTTTMLVGLATIGLVGYLIERVIFQTIEARTVVRWGMVQE